MGGWGPFRTTFIKGAAITAGSTLFSVALAIEIECLAHRTLYRIAPHKYARVDQAYGLTQEQLLAVRDPTWQGAKRKEPKNSVPVQETRHFGPLHERNEWAMPSALPMPLPAETLLLSDKVHHAGFNDETVFVVPATRTETKQSFLAPLFANTMIYRQEILSCAMTG
jgi:hypothetical protein